MGANDEKNILLNTLVLEHFRTDSVVLMSCILLDMLSLHNYSFAGVYRQMLRSFVHLVARRKLCSIRTIEPRTNGQDQRVQHGE